jgi:pSer/pThr/pTyr-binding forkhead associated (FHA) protein
MAYLVVTARGKESYRIKLDSRSSEPLVVGRAVGCAIWIHDPMLSRQHCRIVRRDGQWWIEDSGSTNGTRVNGVRIKEPQALKDAQAIEVGDSRIVFHVDNPVAARPADPIEAMQVQRMIDASNDSRITSQETLLGQKTAGLNDSQVGTKQVRPQPQQPATPTAKSIAFHRPPAKPIVEEDGKHKCWLGALVSKVTQRNTETRNSNDD